MNKKAQVTIFIIIAIVLVGLVIAFFLIGPEKFGISAGEEIYPPSFVEDCASGAAENTLSIIVPQGGFVNPKNYKIYNDIKATYLCENIGEYKPCINQHPMLIKEISKEIKNNITQTIESCYIIMKREFKKRNAKVEFLTPLNISVSLRPDRVFIDVDRKVVITKEKETRTFEEMRFELINPIYNLAGVAMKISADEAKFCDFNSIDYMQLNPRFSIKRWVMSDSTKIYTIKDKNTEKEMNIAIRGCVPPSLIAQGGT